MRILFLTDNFPPEVNASASRVYERAVYWAQWGHEVCVLTSAPNFPDGKLFPGYQNKWRQTEKLEGIEVIRVKTFITPNKGFGLRMLDFLSYMIMAVLVGSRIKKPDIIIATSPQLLAALAGWQLSVIKGCPFIFELGDLWPASILSVTQMSRNFFIRLLEKLELFLYHRSKAIISLTNAFKKNLISRGIEAQKIFVIRNGVNKFFFEPQDKDLELTKTLGLTQSPENPKETPYFVLGYIGTLGMAQGLENIIYAAQHLKNYPIKILFVGSGAEKENLMALTDKLELQNVIFVPIQPKSEIKKYWKLCDVALVHLKNQPVFETVIPSKIFEAMAMQCPILFAGRKGEASELIHQTEIGICLPPEQPELLAQTILELSQRPEQLKKYQMACAKAAPQFTRENQAKWVIDVLEKMKT